MPALYHVNVYMPPQMALPCHRGRLQYSRHALNEAANDRYGKFELISSFDPSKAKLIETAVVDGPNGRNSVIEKQLWRMPIDDKRDLVLAICPGGFVKTVWVNRKCDKHDTLDHKRYNSEPKTYHAK